jgi:glycosyltransferase involved in cell wall biosynthesis
MVILGEAGPLEADLERRGVASSVLPMHPDLQSLRREHVRPGRALLGESATAVAYTVRLTRELKRRQPDLVATNSLKAALYGGLAGRLAGIPVVWHLRDRLAADYLPAPAVRLLQLLARGIPSAVIANSRTTANTIGAASVARRTFVVHDPVEPTGVPSRRIEPEVRRVGLVGRIAPWKGQDLFLRAFARAFQHTDTEAVIVGAALFGEHEYERGLHELVSALGLAGRVDFRGFRTDVDAELLRLDILVHASTIPEPFGMVVIEGMALGLPVVVPDRGGPSEVVSADHDGVTYRLGDVDSLAAALTRVANDADGRQRLGRAARVTAARFAPEQVAGEVQSVYEWVLAHKP